MRNNVNARRSRRIDYQEQSYDLEPAREWNGCCAEGEVFGRQTEKASRQRHEKSHSYIQAEVSFFQQIGSS